MPMVTGPIYKPLRGSFTLHYWEDGGRVKSPAHPVMINCHSHSAHYSLLPPPPPSPLSGFLSSSFIGLPPLPPSPPDLSGFLLLLVYSAFSYSISSSISFTLIIPTLPSFCISVLRISFLLFNYSFSCSFTRVFSSLSYLLTGSFY